MRDRPSRHDDPRALTLRPRFRYLFGCFTVRKLEGGMRALDKSFSVTIEGEHSEGNARDIYAVIDAIPDQLRQVGVRVSGSDVSVGFEHAAGTQEHGWVEEEVEVLGPQAVVSPSGFRSADFTIRELAGELAGVTDAVAMATSLEHETRKGAVTALKARLAELG